MDSYILLTLEKTQYLMRIHCALTQQLFRWTSVDCESKDHPPLSFKDFRRKRSNQGPVGHPVEHPVGPQQLRMAPPRNHSENTAAAAYASEQIAVRVGLETDSTNSLSGGSHTTAVTVSASEDGVSLNQQMNTSDVEATHALPQESLTQTGVTEPADTQAANNDTSAPAAKRVRVSEPSAVAQAFRCGRSSPRIAIIDCYCWQLGSDCPLSTSPPTKRGALNCETCCVLNFTFAGGI